jgi:hypothetical protein
MSLTVGDCLHNLRAALDYIVWDLAGTKGTRSHQFPIVEDSTEFWKQAIKRGRLADVDPAAQTDIEKLQPYHGRNGARNHPLWLLNELVNADKHHALVLTAVIAKDMQFRVGDARGGFFGGTHRNGDILWQSQRGVFPKVEIQNAVQIAFKEPPAADLDVTELLKSILQNIQQKVVPALTPFLHQI